MKCKYAVSYTHLDVYKRQGLYKMKDHNKNYYNKTTFKGIYKKIMNSMCELRYSDFTNEFSFKTI